jgi:uncharacterized protein YkwD
MLGRSRDALVFVLLASCGRVDFATIDAATVPADARPDAAPAVCGDNVCSGDQGELCATCTDCKTLSQVCGNGACEAGEDSCYADCGPLPWPSTWQTEATDMLAALNQARTTGVMCPGSGTVTTAPPLTYDPTIEPTAREWAWEAAHENWIPADSCNGRTALDRITAAGLGTGSAWKVFDSASPTDAINMLLAYNVSCPNLMTPSVTKFAAAAAHDLITSHAVALR